MVIKNKLLMVAPSFAFRGGIARVTLNYKMGGLFNQKIQYLPSIIEGPRIIKFMFTLKQLFLFLFKLFFQKYSLIHIHTSSYLSFYRKSFFILVAKLTGKKIILHIHPTHFYKFILNSRSFRKFWIYNVLKLCDSFIVLTTDMQTKMEKIFPTKTIHILPNPVSVSDFNNSQINMRRDNVLLYLGTFFREKGVYDLISAASLILEEIPNMEIILCGDKGKSKLKKEIKKIGLDGKIQVKKWVGGLQKKQLLNESTAIILPSYTEGIPNVILEAMSSGVPIIATPVGGVPSILEDEKNCLFFKPGDILDLKIKVIRMFRNTALQNEIIRNNYIKVKSFDTSVIIDKLKGIYKNL